MLKKLLKNKTIRGLVRLIKSIIENDFYGMAAEMGFMLVVGIFPFMLFLMAVFGWLGSRSYLVSILHVLSGIMPNQAMNLLQSVLEETMIFNHGKLMAIIGIVTTLVLSTNGVAVILKGLNRAYKVIETRNFIYTRVLSFLMVFVNILVMFLTINIIIFGKVIITFLVNDKICCYFDIDPSLACCIFGIVFNGLFDVLHFAGFEG